MNRTFIFPIIRILVRILDILFNPIKEFYFLILYLGRGLIIFSVLFLGRPDFYGKDEILIWFLVGFNFGWSLLNFSWRLFFTPELFSHPKLLPLPFIFGTPIFAESPPPFPLKDPGVPEIGPGFFSATYQGREFFTFSGIFVVIKNKMIYIWINFI